ncbi:MAG: GIY-YIG nuclease family protein [Cyclobacteriaceae bacterium]|nr:GIY-YIG nuclease family protein [Cyclobacteriaceae bacterium]MBX2955006.1 GIY-YIG nuclease family protein [Cyclobacteriaceae bacterium]
MAHQYYVYITTNPSKTTFYTGVTNDLAQRITEHYLNRGNPSTFAGKYYCYLLIFWEHFQYVNDAIAREKEIKGWSRKKKIELIKIMNPTFNNLNPSIMDYWPPKNPFHRKDL